jgi:hypothetical protein
MGLESYLNVQMKKLNGKREVRHIG